MTNFSRKVLGFLTFNCLNYYDIPYKKRLKPLCGLGTVYRISDLEIEMSVSSHLCVNVLFVSA